MRTCRLSCDASSEASLWDNLDDTDPALVNFATPLLAVQPTCSASRRLSPPPPSESRAKPLELELFPSIEAVQSRTPLTPASLHINGADMGNPHSQIGVNSTQFMREEWLTSAAFSRSRKLNNEDANPVATTTSKFFTSSNVGRTPSRPASSLLDKLDEICGSSPSASKSNTPQSSGSARGILCKSAGPRAQQANENGSNSALPTELDSFEIGPDDDSGAETSQIPRVSLSHPSEQEDLTAMDILNMSCSPPSQLMPHITLIKDMPEDQQQIYHRLAFSSSSGRSSQSSARGVTARGTTGKTWKATWQHDEQDGAANVGASTSKRRTLLTARKPRSTTFKKWPPRRGGKGRGRRP